MRHRTMALLAPVSAAWLLASVARADEQAPPPGAAPAPPSLLPAMTGPLAVNAKPASFDLGPLGGKVYITGALTGLAMWQNSVAPGDHDSQLDISNGQVFINKPDGLFQYFVEVGAYALPDIGAPYVKASTATRATYGVVPQALFKIAPTPTFSVEVGKLPTLMGAEYTFSFENINVERGLLWNQEPAVSRGVQANYTLGSVAFSVSLNDGLYSNHYSWVSASATWTINKTNTLALIGAGNTERTDIATTATPLFQNNEQIYNLIYTYTNGPWIVEPYVQYSHVPNYPAVGGFHSATTFGGALFIDYSFGGKSRLAGFSLPVRFEYITTSGGPADGIPNLLYGSGSNAWSITVTPTYQYKIYFIRAELSYVSATNATPGSVFGPNGLATSQTRGLIETGVLF
ncbi:MAG TPA: outer membrane beta-barrel protein [Caulobacteraceae bacterium]|nr:outer membrane beta-barrel protein [Caulobacteraceae bacterium]